MRDRFGLAEVSLEVCSTSGRIQRGVFGSHNFVQEQQRRGHGHSRPRSGQYNTSSYAPDLDFGTDDIHLQIWSYRGHIGCQSM